MSEKIKITITEIEQVVLDMFEYRASPAKMNYAQAVLEAWLIKKGIKIKEANDECD